MRFFKFLALIPLAFAVFYFVEVLTSSTMSAEVAMQKMNIASFDAIVGGLLFGTCLLYEALSAKWLVKQQVSKRIRAIKNG